MNLYVPNKYNIDQMRILQNLFRLGFRVISQEVSMVVGADENGIFYFLEIVFMTIKTIWNNLKKILLNFVLDD